MAAISRKQNRDRTWSWTAQVRIKPFRPVAKTFSDRKQAEAWATALEAELRAERDSGQTREDLSAYTVRDLVHEYLADPASQSLGSRRNRLEHLSWWVNEYGGERVRALSVLKLREARDKLRPGRAPATVNRYLASWRACWNWGRSAGLVPLERVWPPKLMLTEPSQRVRFLDDDELARVMGAAKDVGPTFHAAVVVSLATGLRQGELLRLRWKDISLDRARLQVLVAKNKTPRSVHLPPVAVQALRTLREATVVGRSVFLNTDGAPLTGGQLDKLWRGCRTAAKLRDFRWHDLRHSCASFLAQNGASLLEIKSVLGHKSVAATNRYAHLVEGAPVKGHDALNDKLSGGA